MRRWEIAVVWSLGAGLAGCGSDVLLGGVMGSDGGPGSAALVPLDAAGGPGSGSSSSGGGGSGSGSSGAGSSGSGSGGSASSSGAAALDATLSDATPGDATLSDVVPGDATAPLDVQGMPPSDAAPPVAPSCAAGGDGLTNCGQNSESCCTSLPVTGDTFYRTYTNSGTGPTGEADPATVSDFRLDEYDVTVGRFRQFVNAVLPPSGSGWLPAPGSGKHTHLNGGLGLANTAPDSGVSYETGWVGSDDIYVAPTTANLSCDAYATWTASPAGDETRPITCVDWYEAYAFCIWDGGFLPSDAEWEFAAAGGTDQRDYPWGTTDPGTANQYAIFGDAQNGGSCYYPTGTLTTCTGPGNIAPVGTAYLGAGRWGQLDLVGNTEQWVLDWAGYYDPSVDAANLTGGLNRALRGNGFHVASGGLHAWLESATVPLENTVPVRAGGFRCARPPLGAAPVLDASTPLDASPAASTVPSCTNAGAGRSSCGTGGDDCCTTLEVTGGTFYRTYANDGTGPTGEANPATISSFLLDKYDVTVGRFRQFRDAVLPPDGGAGWTPSAGSGKHVHLNGGLGLVEALPDASFAYEPGWIASDDAQIAPTTANLQCGNIFYPTWTDAAGSHETLPIDCVNWYEAYAFCIWDGGFLPSQAEWEYAAAGGGEQREYPWGSASPGTGNQYAIYGCNYPMSDSAVCASVANIAPVGTASLGAGLWGQLDLAGNVSQWALDWSSATAAPSFIDPCVDCVNLAPASQQIETGSDFYSTGLVPLTPLSGALGQLGRTARDAGTGFRCARAPQGVVGPHSGVLDTTLAGTGYVTWFGPAGVSLPRAAATGVALDYSVTGTDRIVVVGVADGPDSLGRAVAVRFTSDGALDTTFGTGGYWMSQESPPLDATAGATYVGAQAGGVVVDYMGRPRLVGYIATVYPDNPDVFGLTASGVPDTTFGQNGLVSPTVTGAGTMRNAYAIAIDGAQSVTVGGIAVPPGGGDPEAAIARYTNAGTPDNTLGASGYVFASHTTGGPSDAASVARGDSVTAVALQARTLVAAGTSIDENGRQDVVVWRYTTAGALDPTFNGTGYAVLSGLAGDTSSSGYDEAQAVAIDAAGLIYVAGYSSYAGGGSSEAFVARLTTSGALDASFGSGGVVTLAPLPGGDSGYTPRSYATGLAIDSRNRIVVSGNVNNGYSGYVAAWRLTSTGAFDTSFGVDGRFAMNGTAGYEGDTARSVALTPQDGVVLAGSAPTTSGAQALAVWLLTP